MVVANAVILRLALLPLDEPQAHGAEQVEFRVAGHAGATPKPVGKVASGGELSRVSPGDEVELCHATGSESNPIVEIEKISESGLAAHLLHHLAVGLAEGGAQRLVPARDLVQRAGQRVRVQLAAQAPAGRLPDAATRKRMTELVDAWPKDVPAGR